MGGRPLRHLLSDAEEEMFHIWGNHGLESPYPCHHIFDCDAVGSDFASDNDI